MLEDARRIPTGTRIEADVCIVGSGPAGLSIAHALEGSGATLCVLEAGAERPDRATQSLLAGESAFFDGDELQRSRLSALGGTSRIWSGWCRPLDAEVFEPRRQVPGEGWPFGREELDPFYARAHELCGLGPFEYAPDRWRSQSDSCSPLQLDSDSVETRLYQMSPPTHFGREHRDRLRQSRGVRVLLRAVCTELATDASGRCITAVRVATLGGNHFEVVPGFTVLAAGGIENARLLLLSDRQVPGGLGNERDLVGRYFMEHPYVTAGRLALERPGDAPLSFYYPHASTCDGQRATVRGVIGIPRSRLEKEGLLPVALFPLPAWESAGLLGSRGAGALRELALSWRSGWLPERTGARLARALGDPAGCLGSLYHRLLRPRLGAGAPGTLRIRAFCESEPVRSNRVRLCAERDRLGRRRVRVDWTPSELERRSLARGFELLGRALERAGIGRLTSTLGSDAEDPIEGGRHHMGTTRMHADAARGVVDADGRVHGTANLFVAGSSLFPAAGFANPTLTIVALALRLADHVRARLRP